MISEFELFMKNENYSHSTEVEKNLIKELVTCLEEKEFEVYPEWRKTHNVNGKRVFVFKAANPRNKIKEPNIITVYPMSNWLKVEVYHGEYNKHIYDFYSSDMDEELYEDIYSVYSQCAVLKPSPKPDLDENYECPYKIGYKLIHNKFGEGNVISIENSSFEVQFNDGCTKKFKTEYTINNNFFSLIS